MSFMKEADRLQDCNAQTLPLNVKQAVNLQATENAASTELVPQAFTGPVNQTNRSEIYTSSRLACCLPECCSFAQKA